tara:strand:+ start:891 stop:1841 length:951 start_codon:yes stop_codon:yes gene_type:complete
MNSIKFYSGLEYSNWLVSLAIGKKYIDRFEKFILPLAKEYCLINNIGIACVVNDIDGDLPIDVQGKKKTWQKLLIPFELNKYSDNFENVCYFDSDILFNPYGKNIFKYHVNDSIGIVSQVYGLPGDLLSALKTISFSRNKYYSKEYPLDSAIFMDSKEYYNFHGYKEFNDIACAGLYVANLSSHKDILKKIFCKYKTNTDSLTDGGDEPAFNYEVRANMKINSLPYEFQALWQYEMAWHYRDLYVQRDIINDNSLQAICNSLMNKTALHFAGSWYEASLCYDVRIIDKMLSNEMREFFKYQNRPADSTPVGRIIPK